MDNHFKQQILELLRCIKNTSSQSGGGTTNGALEVTQLQILDKQDEIITAIEGVNFSAVETLLQSSIDTLTSCNYNQATELASLIQIQTDYQNGDPIDTSALEVVKDSISTDRDNLTTFNDSIINFGFNADLKTVPGISTAATLLPAIRTQLFNLGIDVTQLDAALVYISPGVPLSAGDEALAKSALGAQIVENSNVRTCMNTTLDAIDGIFIELQGSKTNLEIDFVYGSGIFNFPIPFKALEFVAISNDCVFDGNALSTGEGVRISTSSGEQVDDTITVTGTSYRYLIITE